MKFHGDDALHDWKVKCTPRRSTLVATDRCIGDIVAVVIIVDVVVVVVL